MSEARRTAGYFMLVEALAVIALVTLTPVQFSYRAHTLRLAFDFSPLHLREDALNAVLFAPLGVAAAALALRARGALLLAATVSIVVEALQLTVVQGRFAELQDVVANVVGAMIGWALWRAFRR